MKNSKIFKSPWFYAALGAAAAAALLSGYRKSLLTTGRPTAASLKASIPALQEISASKLSLVATLTGDAYDMMAAEGKAPGRLGINILANTFNKFSEAELEQIDAETLNNVISDLASHDFMYL